MSFQNQNQKNFIVPCKKQWKFVFDVFTDVHRKKNKHKLKTQFLWYVTLIIEHLCGIHADVR